MTIYLLINSTLHVINVLCFGQKPSPAEVRSSFTQGAPPWESSEFMNPADPEDLLLQYGKTFVRKKKSNVN